MASCPSCADILVVVVAPTKRFGIDVIFWGQLVMTQGAWLSLKDYAISMKPGSHVIFFATSLSGGVDTCSKIVCLLGVVGVEVVGAIVAVGMMRGLGHPRREVVWKEPLGWALCIVFPPHALIAPGPLSPFLGTSQRCYLHPGEGGSFTRSSLSVKEVNGSIASLNSQMLAASWHGVYQSEMAELSQPKIVGLWQAPGSSLTLWAYSPSFWSYLQFVVGGHPILCSRVQVAGCGHSPFFQGTLPWGTERKPAPT